MPLKYKLASRRADDGSKRRIYNVERWENGRFTGGLRVEKKTWSDPMWGSECDFKNREQALIALLEAVNLGVPIEIGE